MKSAACHEQKTIYLHLHFVKHATNHRYSSRGHFYAAVCLVLLLYWNQLFVYPWLVRTMDHEEADDNDIRAAVCLVDQWLLCCYYKTTGFSTIGCNKNQLITIIISICFFIYCSASIVCIFIIFYTIIRVQTFRSKIRRAKRPFLESQMNANFYKEF